MIQDPVCGMVFDAEDAAARSEFHGQEYYFCSPHCKILFDEDPAKHIWLAEFSRFFKPAHLSNSNKELNHD